MLLYQDSASESGPVSRKPSTVQWQLQHVGSVRANPQCSRMIWLHECYLILPLAEEVGSSDLGGGGFGLAMAPATYGGGGGASKGTSGTLSGKMLLLFGGGLIAEARRMGGEAGFAFFAKTGNVHQSSGALGLLGITKSPGSPAFHRLGSTVPGFGSTGK